MGILGQGRPGEREDQAKFTWRLESLGIHFKHFQVPGTELGAGSAAGRRQRHLFTLWSLCPGAPSLVGLRCWERV